MIMSRPVFFLFFFITGFRSKWCFDSSTEINKQNNLFLSTIVYPQNSSVLKNNLDSSPAGDVFKPYLLISDPLFQDISWNSSVPNELNRKRDAQVNGLSHELKMQILQLHNIYRSNVTPSAGDMAYMEWDEELAKLAQLWSDNCSFNHGMPENNYPETIGQNLYIGTDPTGYLGLWMWFEEYLNYDLRKQYCLPNKQCGHYVQMAWAASTKLGCGMKQCGMRYFLTCHYSPGALRGTQMYRVAKPCSQCSSKKGGLCLKNLCITWDQCKLNPFECQFARCDLECLNCGRLDKKKCLCECADGWDSPDCSHLCKDKHVRCGMNPGWPTKSACSLNRNAVAETFCRKMCEMCSPVDEKLSTHTCCNGTLCDDGFVLDTHDKSCKCSLLCPGPMCDNQDEGEIQASLQDNVSHLSATSNWINLAIVICLNLIFMKEITCRYV